MATNLPTASRSLYWRIVLTFCVCVGGVLAIQLLAAVVWLNRVPDPSRLHAFTDAVAADLETALRETPRLDVEAYVRHRYPHPIGTLYIVIADTGQVVVDGPTQPPAGSVAGAREFYQSHPTSLPESWLTGPYQVAPITVDGRLAGGVGVIVPTWKELIGWKMAALSGALLLAGTSVAALVIFGPMRRRLDALGAAARRFGAGDFSARADENGGDELAAFAASFNGMAIDLEHRHAQLKAADRTRRLLLADVSHELMTPLTAIRAHHEVLAMSALVADDEAVQSLNVIADATERLESLIGDLLDLARLEAGGDSLELHEVSIENLFGRVMAHHEPQARRHGVTMSAVIGADAEIVCGDRMRLEQALGNLVANALRHTPPGGEIELRAESTATSMRVSVRDTGSGIPAEHAPFVFDRFYKVDPARANDGPVGSGLGLSIVKAIVERHGGTISLLSEPGVATVFSIDLPFDRTSARAIRARGLETGEPVDAR